MPTVESAMREPRLLGKLPPRYDSRTLRLENYVERRKLPVVPSRHNLSRKTVKAFPDLGQMKNNELGCCTISALGHSFQTWTTFGGMPWRPTDLEIVSGYGLINHGVDGGAYMLDALNLARQMGIGNNTIFAFAAVDPLNHDQVRTALYLFSGLYIGMNLPESAQHEKVWTKTSGPGTEPGSWGGHCVNVVDFDAKGLTVVTWGELQKMTWAWADRYIDEAYVILEEDLLGADRRSPQGFSFKKLASDLSALR